MDSKLYHDVYHYLEHGDYPMDLMMEEKKVLKEKKRNFRKKCELFVVKDGILYHYPSKGKSALKEVVKDEDVGRILKAFHGDKAGGCHFGVTTTFTKLSERFWWKGMYDNVLKLVNSCLQCQQQNVVKKGPIMQLFLFQLCSHDLISHKYKVSQIPHNAVFCMLLTHYVIYNVHTRRNTVLQGGKITNSRFPPGGNLL